MYRIMKVNAHTDAFATTLPIEKARKTPVRDHVIIDCTNGAAQANRAVDADRLVKRIG